MWIKDVCGLQVRGFHADRSVAFFLMRDDVTQVSILNAICYDEDGSMHPGMASRYDCKLFFETVIF